MAGKPLAFLQENLGHTFVVRAMPNAPAILGMGITAYTPSDALTFKQIRQVENLLNTTGRSVFLEDESLMDAVTAVSGSGPAYFYFFVRSMMEAAESMGLDESTASLLVKQTMLGAFHVMNNSEKSIEELIQVVASKGGTTEAALRVFHETEIHTHIIQALHAAAARAKALANG
jgi:pyrroline-5-carboxylate reductase